MKNSLVWGPDCERLTNGGPSSVDSSIPRQRNLGCIRKLSTAVSSIPPWFLLRLPQWTETWECEPNTLLLPTVLLVFVLVAAAEGDQNTRHTLYCPSCIPSPQQSFPNAALHLTCLSYGILSPNEKLYELHIMQHSAESR